MFLYSVIQQIQGKEKDIQKNITFAKKHIITAWILNGVLLASLLGLHSYPLYVEVMDVRETIELQREDNMIEKEKLTTLLKEKEEVQNELLEVEESLGEILPRVLPPISSEMDYQKSISDIAVFFEDYAMRFNQSMHPFILNDLSFGGMNSRDGIIQVQVTLNFLADLENLIGLLNFITYQTGSMDQKDFYKYSLSTISKEKVPIPAMVIDSLNLSMAGVNDIDPSSTDKNIGENYMLNISVYFKDEMTNM